ncbi:MAG: LLM class flavin-dependent oxidoreductase [Myxococcota bacterium]|nr:LLM class flavin-dependent oxidoreductase [Myxococcales bacterium]
MDVAICIPYMERDYDRRTTLDWCRLVDDGPFSTLSCGERVTSYTQHMTVILSAAAALTKRVRINPSLYVLPAHDATWVAKEIATLDVLSGGRLTVTVGVGGREHDYRAVNAPFAGRHQRLDEQVAHMKRLWAGEPPFEGCDPVGPTPVQAGGPPLLSGSMGPKAMARAAKWAAGVYGFTLNGNPETAKNGFAMADAAWKAAGRSDAPFRATGFWYSLSPDDAQGKLVRYVHDYMKIQGDAVAKAVAGTMRTSSADAVRKALDDIEATGCQECFLVPATLELAEVERAAEIVAKR